MVPQLCLLVLVLAYAPLARPEIHDPLHIFCGSENCYDVLNVKRKSALKEIKSSYRKLSLTAHPDKSTAHNATEVFRRISKAYEVLTGNASRDLFNYYLDHPRDYFKVSGTHYFRNPPKIDARIIVLVLLALFSWLLHVLQFQRWEFAVKDLVRAAICNAGLKNGGSKQSQEIFRRATELYDSKASSLSKADLVMATERALDVMKGNKLSALLVMDEDGKPLGKTKMQKDPIFLEIIDDIVSQVQFEGPSRKPTFEDALIVLVCKSPLYVYQWFTSPSSPEVTAPKETAAELRRAKKRVAKDE